MLADVIAVGRCGELDGGDWRLDLVAYLLEHLRFTRQILLQREVVVQIGGAQFARGTSRCHGCRSGTLSTACTPPPTTSVHRDEQAVSAS